MTVNVDGREVRPGVVLIGEATEMPDGTWRSLANCLGSLAVVELTIWFPVDMFDAPLV